MKRPQQDLRQKANIEYVALHQLAANHADGRSPIVKNVPGGHDAAKIRTRSMASKILFVASFVAVRCPISSMLHVSINKLISQ